MRNSVRGVALLALVLYGASAFACSCGTRRPPAEKFARAKLVFVGKVIEVEDRNTVLRRLWRSLRGAVGHEPRFDDWREWGFDVTLQVTAMWRGAGIREMRLLTGRGGGDCGVKFAKGETYVVYAYRNEDDDWQADICSGTRLTDDATADLAWLAKQPKVRLP